MKHAGRTVSMLMLIAAASTATAQTPTYPGLYPQPLAQVKEFLQLSDAQVQIILANNEEYNRWSAAKQARGSQVQGEIAEETAKDVLNPMALGVRYVEVETICREMKAQAAVSLKKNVDSLTAPQKAKLQVLQDAIKLAPVISDAQSGNLLATAGFFPQFFSSSGNGNFSAIFGLIGPAGGCFFPPEPRWFGPAPAGVQPTQQRSR